MKDIRRVVGGFATHRMSQGWQMSAFQVMNLGAVALFL